MSRRAGVLGSPIAHSLSPLLHRTAYDMLGLQDWTYDAYDVAENDLPAFLDQLDESWAGVSLTMPLKAAVLPLLTTRSALVEAVGAANTVVVDEAGLAGENTDVPGMVAALAEAGVQGTGERRVSRADGAVVLGAGATARSAVAALGQLGFRVTVFARSAARRDELAAVAVALDVALDVQSWDDVRDGLAAPLVVNTTPSGATDTLQRAIPPRPGLLFEVGYAPWPTPLAAAWAARSGRVVGGLELLVQQAVRQVALMTRLPIDVDQVVGKLRAAGAAALNGNA